MRSIINNYIHKLRLKLFADRNLKELLSGSTVAFVFKILGMLLSYCVVFVISSKYGAEGVGLYNITFRIITSVALVSSLGFNTSVLRYVGEFNTKENKGDYLNKIFKIYTYFSIPVSIFLAIILYILSEFIAIKMFENINYTNAIKVIAVVLPFFTLNLINVEFIRGLKLLKVSEYLRSVNTYIIIIFILQTSLLDFDLLSSIYALSFGIVITFIISSLFIFYHIRNLPHSNHHVSLLKSEFIKTSLPMMIITISSFVLAFSGVFFLEGNFSTDKVGVYSVCVMLSQLVSIALTVVNTISAPKFSELYWDNKKEELKKLLQHSSKLIFWSSFLLSILLVLASKVVLTFFGEDFIFGQNILIILIFGQLINAITGSVGVFLSMTGHQKVLRNIIFTTTIFVVLGYYILIPVYGMLGAAIISVFGTILINVSSAIYVFKKLKYITFYVPFLSRVYERK